MAKTKIITLCGSTRFKDEFIAANFLHTMMGYIVLSVGWFGHADSEIYLPTELEKTMLDELHFRKIDISDEIFVINKDQYIGYSTRREIAYAFHSFKTRFYTSPNDSIWKRINFLENQFHRPGDLLDFIMETDLTDANETNTRPSGHGQNDPTA